MRIELNNVKPKYMSDSEVAGSDIYLQPHVVFERGKKYMVRAQSGHGKTSLLNFIYGKSTDFDGQINYHEIVNDAFALRVNKLSYLFQDLCLFHKLTAVENVQIKNILTNHKSEAEIDEMFEAVHMANKKNQTVDEPFSHIDNDNAMCVANLVKSEVERQHAGLIVTALDDTDAFEFNEVMNL